MSFFTRTLFIAIPSIILFSCNFYKVSDEEMKRRGSFLIKNITAEELLWFSTYSYSTNSTFFGLDPFETYTKQGPDHYLYECAFNSHRVGDTITLSVSCGRLREDSNAFTKDFPMTLTYNPMRYNKIYFKMLPDSSIQVELNRSFDKDSVVGIYKKGELFTANNPFVFFKKLSNSVKKYLVVKINSNPYNGKFIEFNFGAGMILMYMPDTSAINPMYNYKRQTIDRFEQGKKIGEDWSLVK